MGPTAFLPFRRKSYSGFFHSEKSIVPGRVERANLGSSGEYDNNGTTGVDTLGLQRGLHTDPPG